MCQQPVLQFLAIVVLACIATVLSIDFAADCHVKTGVQLKWSLLWYACRCIGSICAAVLALDVLF